MYTQESKPMHGIFGLSIAQLRREIAAKYEAIGRETVLEMQYKYDANRTASSIPNMIEDLCDYTSAYRVKLEDEIARLQKLLQEEMASFDKGPRACVSKTPEKK